jgi:hypothetical protein
VKQATDISSAWWGKTFVSELTKISEKAATQKPADGINGTNGTNGTDSTADKKTHARKLSARPTVERIESWDAADGYTDPNQAISPLTRVP